MSSVSCSFPDYFTGREVGTEVSLGNYSILKVLCIPSSVKGSHSTWGQTDDRDMWVAVLCFIKHLAEQTVYQFPIRSFLRCKSIWSKDSDMQTRIPTFSCLCPFQTPKQQQPLRPNVIRPAAPWQGANTVGEGGSKSAVEPLMSTDLQNEQDSALPCEGDWNNLMVESNAGPSRDESVDVALQQPGPSELNGPSSELTSNQEPGPSLLPPIKMSPQPANNTETISLENADLPPQQEEKMEAREWQGENLEPEQKLEEIAAKTTMEQEEIQENSQLEPRRLPPLEDKPRAVAKGCAPQQGQPEADPGSLRAYGEKAPGPAFPRPEPQQDGIPGPASPQPAHPPEESGQQAGRDNEQPGPAFPAQGSHELGSGDVPEQGAAGQEQDLTALLIRETVSIPRAPLPPVCVMFSDRFFKVCRVSHAQNTQLNIFSCKQVYSYVSVSSTTTPSPPSLPSTSHI